MADGFFSIIVLFLIVVVVAAGLGAVVMDKFQGMENMKTLLTQTSEELETCRVGEAAQATQQASWLATHQALLNQQAVAVATIHAQETQLAGAQATIQAQAQVTPIPMVSKNDAGNQARANTSQVVTATPQGANPAAPIGASGMAENTLTYILGGGLVLGLAILLSMVVVLVLRVTPPVR